MIFGVIVSIFSEIREKANFKENDQNNKCFICSIDRAIFERLKIGIPIPKWESTEERKKREKIWTSPM